MDLEALGLSKADIEEKIIDNAVYLFMDKHIGCEVEARMSKLIQETVDSSVNSYGKKHVAPIVEDGIENVTFVESNKWGEPKSEPATFREYLAKRATEYLTESVDSDGKAKWENPNRSFYSSQQTRVAYMIHKYLHYEIEKALKLAVKDLNDSVAEGLQKTVNLKLQEVLSTLRTTVQIKTK